MSRTSVEVSIAPDVFRWLCGTSGWLAKDIAKRIEVPEEDVRSWYEGKTKPILPLTKVERLSEAFKRPLAAFLLSKPPEEIKLLPDFRKLPGVHGDFSKETHLAIRKAWRLQNVRSELMENLGSDVRITIKNHTIQDDPETVANNERVNLPVDLAQISTSTPTKLFQIWRDWFEQKNIMVLQLKMPVEDARGFSLTDIEPFVIVVNESDAPNAKIFTLFHEYGHILLNESAVCNRDSDVIDDTRIKKIEYWCNRFAGAFLVPEDFLKKELDIERLIQTTHYSRIVASIANKLKISKESALMRLLTLDYISPSEFRAERDKIRADAALLKEQIREKQSQSAKKSGPAISLDQKCLNEKGHRFVSLVLKNSDLGYITSRDALDYLDIKMKNLEKLRAES
ncbi:MAG: ImmA/IrrE family metallo-endopeptidase [Methanoregula sp.]|nr:ImmA/IrrE family metallo-endopeptidase [Methanoregula sp.]